MAATDKDLEKLADLKFRLRKTDLEAAEYFGVSQRTIQRWVRSSRFGDVAINYKATQIEGAKSQLAGLADDIIGTLSTLMKTSRSDFVRVQAAQTLGKWMGLENIVQDTNDDDREEVKDLLRAIADNTSAPPMLPPPLPGGALPQLNPPVILDAHYTIDNGEKEGESS
jgi:transcriptional regulator with XRE-family HTH domain